MTWTRRDFLKTAAVGGAAATAGALTSNRAWADFTPFYTFEGGPTRSGSVYTNTDANGVFTVVRDISGSSPVEYVEAWAWVGGKEKYLSDCQPSPDNYFGYWKFDCSGPEIWLDNPPSP